MNNKRHRGSNLSLQEPDFLKGGDRPVREDGEVLDFEDEYEDEFESEDEILEAGVDGRPDAEREAEEAGTPSSSHVMSQQHCP
jgi:ribosome assembly protein RRB1